MNIFALSALSFSMSMDAFAVSVVRGATDKHIPSAGFSRLMYALKIGVIFGTIETITPIFGYFIGTLAQQLVQDFDHWLSFVLLSGLGSHIIYESLTSQDNAVIEPKSTSFGKTILTAFATSIDAMVIGISLAFLNVNIWLAGLMIGAFTTIMATLGVFLGAKLYQKIGNKAEIFGGIVLILIGVFILISHLKLHG